MSSGSAVDGEGISSESAVDGEGISSGSAVEGEKDSDDRTVKMNTFKADQLERCKILFRKVKENEKTFNACFWGSSIVVVGDGVVCLGCGDWAMWSPFCLQLIKAHVLRNHRKCRANEAVDGVRYRSTKEPDGFRMPTCLEECPTPEATLALARDSPEALKMWRLQAQTAYGRWGVIRGIMAGSIRGDVLQPLLGKATPDARPCRPRAIKVDGGKPKGAADKGFVDDGLLDGVRLPGKDDMHNHGWHMKEMRRWYSITTEKAEELYAAGVRQAWPGSSFLGHDYEFVDWDLFCLVCYEQRGRVVHVVSAPSMESHLTGKEHRKSLDCLAGVNPSSAATAMAMAQGSTTTTTVTAEELPPPGNPNLKEWHVGQIVKWYGDKQADAAALYDAGIRQGWPGCELLGDAYVFKEWEMFCMLCFRQSGKVIKAMHPDTMRQHIGGRGHKNNVQWASGGWQQQQGGHSSSSSRMVTTSWAASARPSGAVAGGMGQQPASTDGCNISPERAVPEGECRQIGVVADGVPPRDMPVGPRLRQPECESFEEHLPECQLCTSSVLEDIQCQHFVEHIVEGACQDCLVLIFRFRINKRPHSAEASFKSSSSEVASGGGCERSAPAQLSERRRGQGGVAVRKSARTVESEVQPQPLPVRQVQRWRPSLSAGMPRYSNQTPPNPQGSHLPTGMMRSSGDVYSNVPYSQPALPYRPHESINMVDGHRPSTAHHHSQGVGGYRPQRGPDPASGYHRQVYPSATSPTSSSSSSPRQPSPWKSSNRGGLSPYTAYRHQCPPPPGRMPPSRLPQYNRNPPYGAPPQPATTQRRPNARVYPHSRVFGSTDPIYPPSRAPESEGEVV